MKLPSIALIDTLRSYQLSWLPKDLSAGLAIAAVGLPSAIAYPAIAGLPAETGLYASIMALIGYALLGPSQRLVIGPDAATMIVMAATLSKLPPDAMAERAVVASALAILVGLYCLIARVLRLDVLTSFLSRPILTGFMTGIALTIIAGQIGRFTGVAIEADGIVAPAVELLGKLQQVNMPSVILASGMFVFLLLQKWWLPRIPGPVLVTILSIILAWALDLPSLGVKIVGELPSSLPAFSIPWHTALRFDQLIVDALAVWMVSFGSGIASARAFGVHGRFHVDAERELEGFAAANAASGFFGGFPVTASDSRTATNLAAGGKTQIAGLASALILVIALVYLNDWLRILPAPAIGAILAAAAISLIDIDDLRTLWKVSRIEFLFALIALFGTILFGVLNGLVIAIGATLAYVISRGMRPKIVLLGQIHGHSGFYKLHRVEKARPVDGLALLLVQGNLLFYNASHVKHEILDLADKLPLSTRWLVIDGSSIPFTDTTGAAYIIELADELSRKNIKLGLADFHAEPMELLQRAGIDERLGSGMIFASLDDMMHAFEAQSKRDKA